MGLSKKQIQHLYWRAGFGVDPRKLKSMEGRNVEHLVDEIFKESASITPLKINLEAFKVDRKKLSREERKALQKLMNKSMLEMNALWMSKMATTKGVLR
ncbi:MAG: hypothetical protein P8H56_02770 [Crocinitomicaceae bacterium]|nr:hypothetical protein [Crocinitomicaceae bacterium]